ncbi:hypothetical protein E2C01_100994 [Portunus trituberculatus]|uniref:Uncharacterized protein n=1 Tax=Portunus trituberculatus TaxID=210409 RepID=A0A5B7K4J5_PORTR|nr:hypothetical protein [Portunus trituberculatus]
MMGRAAASFASCQCYLMSMNSAHPMYACLPAKDCRVKKDGRSLEIRPESLTAVRSRETFSCEAIVTLVEVTATLTHPPTQESRM